MSAPFGLFLFSVNPGIIRPAMEAGAAAVVVDLERDGKSERQIGADTQINQHTLDDVRRVRSSTDAHLVSRINRRGPATPQEIEHVLEAGADELLLPMVQSCDDVEETLNLIGGRCGLAIMLETQESLIIARELAQLPVSRVYVGLNDLAISLGNPSIFDALADGTVEQLRSLFTVPFGFGGLTLPDRGHPIVCRLLMGEMARLGCQFSVLRRSFLIDTAGSDAGHGVSRILKAMNEQFHRTPAETAQDHSQFAALVESSAPRLRGS